MSGRKNVLMPKRIIVDGDMSGDLDSIVLSSQFQDNVGLQVEWSGSPTGTITVEASVDYDPIDQSGTFYALTFNPTLTQPAGVADGYLINLNQLPFSYYKVAYARTGGTGTLNVYTTSKEI